MLAPLKTILSSQILTEKNIIFQSENISTSIFNTSWHMLSIDNKKIFSIIMIIVQKPITYTSRFFVTLSLKNFLRVS